MCETPIFYLRAYVSASATLCALPLGQARQASVVAHFYVQTDSQPNAGAWAHDWCRFHGLVFEDYICLPNVLTRAQVDGETEHEEAYELALKEGEAVVISAVLGAARECPI